MKKIFDKRALVWLLMLLMLACAALAENGTQVQANVFSAMTYTGDYTVNFYDCSAAESTADKFPIYTKEHVEYGTLISALLPELLTAHPELEGVSWSTPEDYLVLNNVDVFTEVGNAVARLGDTPYNSLQEAIDAVPKDATMEGTTVFLLKDTKEDVDTSGKNLTLDLGGHTITSQYTPVYGNESNLTIKQGKLTGAFYSGVVFVSGTFNAEYLTVDKNIAFSEDGGGIYLSGVTAHMEHCNVTNNEAFSGKGGGIYLENSSLTGAYLTVSDNKASMGGSGGGIYVSGTSTLTLTDSTISKNSIQHTSGNGAGIYIESGTVEGSNLTIWKNETIIGVDSNGAGIYVKTGKVTLSESDIYENKSRGNGGGVYLENGKLTTTNLEIYKNEVINFQGSGMYVAGGTVNANVDIHDNTGAKQGGGIYVAGGDVTLSGSVSSHVTTCGSGIYLKGGTLTGDGLTVIDNEAVDNGGGIYMESGTTLKGKSLTVTDNTAGTNGGGIYVNNSTVSGIESLTVTNNEANNNCGGGIYLMGGTLEGCGLTIGDSTETGNHAKSFGGGIYATTDSKISNVWGTIAGNACAASNGAGGGLCLQGTNLECNELKELTVSNNTAYMGGGIAMHGGSLTGSRLVFSGNEATDGNGGGIFADAAKITLKTDNPSDQAGSFTNNTAGNQGGAIYTTGDLELNGCQFNDNHAQYDAGVYAKATSISIENCAFTGNEATGVFTSSALQLQSFASVKNTTFSGNTGSAAIVTTSGGTFEGCTIDSNNVTGLAAVAVYGETAKTVFQNTLVKGNSGGGTGGIYIDGGTAEIADGSTVTGNTGSGCGGIYNYNGILTIQANAAVYDNKMGSGANDLRITSEKELHTIEASQMVDQHADPQNPNYFQGFYWVDEKNGLPQKDTDAQGKVTFKPVDVTYTEERYFTAMPYAAAYVAEVLHGDEEPKPCYTVASAVLQAKDGDTVRLIYDEKNTENNTPIDENVIVNQNITLDLNGRQLMASSGTALTVQPGYEVKLVGISEGDVSSKCEAIDNLSPAIVNQGTLTIAGGVAVKRIEHRGKDLMLNTTGEIGTVYLAKDEAAANQVNAVTAGKEFIGKLDSSDTKPALIFELDSDVLSKLNQGYMPEEPAIIVTLMKPADGDTKIQESLIQIADGETDAKIKVNNTTGYVKLVITKEGNLVACGTELNGVFVDGQNGNDAMNGLTPASPVETFQQAKKVLEERLAQSTEDEKKAIQGIYVMDTINVTSTEEWSLPEGKMMIRYLKHKGSFADVTGNLTLTNIVLDGGCGDTIQVNDALVRVYGTLNITDGAVLRNNRHMKYSNYTEAGGAVYCNRGTVNMSGGTLTNNTSWYGGGICLWDGTLNMSGGSISENHAEDIKNQKPLGGGVALLHASKMNMSGSASVSGNTSGRIGGGIAVGGDNTNTASTEATFTMQGGTISGNSSHAEGGGIFIQAGATGTITGGSITGNKAAESISAYFGGGGIYVNGSRYGFGDGELYLTNVNISYNHAAYGGGGIAGCNTSSTAVYVTSGGVIYKNTAGKKGPQVWVDNYEFGGMRSPYAYISPYMLGGKAYEWKYSTGRLVPLEVLRNWRNTLGLCNDHTDSSVGADVLSACKVIIAHNTSGQGGGGIGSNGFVRIGTPPVEGEWTPEATKTLTGRDLQAGEFTFTMRDEKGNVVSTGRIEESTADGQPAKIIFRPIKYSSKNGDRVGSTHTYTITEDTTNPLPHITYDTACFTVKVLVAEGYEGANKKPYLTGYVTSITVPGSDGKEQEVSQVAFTNKAPVSAKLDVKVEKKVDGPAPSAKPFTFKLTAIGGAPMPKNAKNGISTVTINGAGQASFGQIIYTQEGKYSYQVQENGGSEPGYTYDTKAYPVTVVVTNQNGVLNASVNGTPSKAVSIPITNKYQPKAVEVKLPVHKEITGSRRPGETTFTFVLEAVTKNAPMPKQNTVAITGAGDAEFGAIQFTKAGTWTYKLSERDGKVQNYDYDDRVYTITVRVTDDNGTLKATWTTDRGNALIFVNEYATPTPTPAPTPTPGPEYTTIQVTKQWEDADDADQIRPASVTVHLERRLAGGEYENVATVALTGTGNTWTYTFDQLPARDDQGQRYEYRIREEAVDGYAVQYDGYTITNIHVAVTPTPEATPMPTPVVVGPTPPGAKGMKFQDGEWIWIDDLGVPLGVVAQTGDNDNLPAVLGGMTVLLVIAGMLVLMIARKKKR